MVVIVKDEAADAQNSIAYAELTNRRTVCGIIPFRWPGAASTRPELKLPKQPDGGDDQSGRTEDPPRQATLQRGEPSVERVRRDVLAVLGRPSHGVGDRIRMLAGDTGVRQLADDGE